MYLELLSVVLIESEVYVDKSTAILNTICGLKFT